MTHRPECCTIFCHAFEECYKIPVLIIQQRAYFGGGEGLVSGKKKQLRNEPQQC